MAMTVPPDRHRFAPLAALLFAALALAACATSRLPSGPASVADFRGEWQGQATAVQNGVKTPRLSYVVIEPDTGGGFTLGWATLLDSEAADPRLRKTVVQFTAAATPGLWVGQEVQDGATNTAYTAEISGLTLNVIATQQESGGVPVVQTYRRTLTEDGLALEFDRSEAGRVTLTVTGTLERITR